MTLFTRSAGVAGMVLLLLVAAALPSRAQAPAPSPSPTLPDFSNFAGWQVFSQAGCGGCHRLRGIGSGPGPDLARIEAQSFYDLGATMWSHLPQMAGRMAATGAQRSRLSPEDASNLLTFLFTAQYFDDSGDPKAGERVFAEKGCVKCHQVGGRGGTVGPTLDRLKGVNSPVILAATMWNHGPAMAERMRAAGIPRPSFTGRELEDLVAYVLATSKEGGETMVQVRPGRPDEGAKVFDAKQCDVCHQAAGRGGQVGPALGGRTTRINLTQFAGRMWNHGPRMWAEMRSRGIDVPQLSGQEAADILAYLYATAYTGPAGSAQRGRQVVQRAGCANCHGIEGKGRTVGPDLARSRAGASPAALVAGMWNHSLGMQIQTQRQNVKWPDLSGQDLSDLAAYLRSLSRPPRKTQ